MKLLRLARKDKGIWEGKVHEEWRVNGPVGKLRNPIIHYPHQALSEFLREINYYTDLRAKELHMQGKDTHWSSIILYPVGKFLLNYLIKRGFVDGMPGLIVAIVMSFHSFLVRAKAWLYVQRR